MVGQRNDRFSFLFLFSIRKKSGCLLEGECQREGNIWEEEEEAAAAAGEPEEEAEDFPVIDPEEPPVDVLFQAEVQSCPRRRVRKARRAGKRKVRHFSAHHRRVSPESREEAVGVHRRRLAEAVGVHRRRHRAGAAGERRHHLAEVFGERRHRLAEVFGERRRHRHTEVFGERRRHHLRQSEDMGERDAEIPAAWAALGGCSSCSW